MRLLLLPVFIFLLSACSTAPASRAPNSLSFTPPREAAAVSLFSGDAAVLSDQDIDKILKYKYVPPHQTRIAVLALGQQFWMGYSDELARGGEEIRTAFTRQLQTSPVIVKAAYLPTLLIPEKRSVAYFREAATRYQADALVVYQSSCQTYQKYRLFSANAVKSFCSVEAAVLDVRTGIVPFTTTATQEFTTEETPSDMNTYEAMQKAEQRAIRQALLKVGEDVAGFFGR